MYGVVHLYGPAASGGLSSTAQAASSLAACIFLGAPVYIASVIGLWLVSGKPPGAEMRILKEIQSRGMRAWIRLRSAFVRG
jgi:hypothetical protein